MTVTGAFGEQPQVTFAEGEQPGEDLEAVTAIAGNGPAVAQGDLAVVQFASYAWTGTSHRGLDNSHDRGKPAVMRIGELIPGLGKSLLGKKVGSRVVMSIPPKDGYGAGGNAETGVTGADTLVYVVDLLAAYPKTATAAGRVRPAGPGLPQVTAGPAGGAPAVAIPASDPPGELRAETLIEGDGPAIRADQMLITHYQGQIWRGGKVFDSSWNRGEVAPLSSLTGTIPGILEGLTGKTVGSRVLLVIPPADGYGKKAPEGAGIKDDDTVVFVIDILGAY
ncbi:FKBP-type peptidyl-prolyl cis-trans isomerase [Nonomuraea sp. NPDC005650]|uniref:FKBP-type peptidyl-prolyl cis-trans isomerase n=1 Tax=Nonomuraea sp. NPDC005650 TaxID=3157045 RepID=UPI0033AD59A4